MKCRQFCGDRFDRGWSPAGVDVGHKALFGETVATPNKTLRRMVGMIYYLWWAEVWWETSFKLSTALDEVKIHSVLIIAEAEALGGCTNS